MPALTSIPERIPVTAALDERQSTLPGLGHIGTWPASMRVMFRMMLDAKQPMSLVWGDERRLLYNDAYVEFLGEKHPAALGEKLDEVWPEIWPDIGPLVDRARAGEAFHMEDVPLMIRRAGGEERAWFTYFFSPARDEDGRLRGMYSSVVETTTRVLGERRQAHLLELTDALAAVDSSDDALAAAGRVLVDYLEPLGGCRVVDQTPEGAARTEVITGEFDAETWERAITSRVVQSAAAGDIAAPDAWCLPPSSGPAPTSSPLDRALLAVRIDRPADAPGRFFFVASRIWTEADSEFASEVARRVTAAIDQWATAAALRELTGSLETTVAERTAELVEARAEAIHIAQRLQIALDSAEIGDWDLDLVTDAAYRSLRHDKCFGYDERIPEWGFETFIHHVHPDDRDRVAQAFRDAIAQIGVWRFEARVIWPDGSLHWIAAYGAVYESNGAPSRMAGVVMDITARKAVDEELRLSNERKDEFLAMLGHELRNPLAPIATAAQLLRMVPEDPARVRTTGEIISRQVGHITALVDDLLDVSRVTRGLVQLDVAPVDMRAVVAAAVEQVRPLVDARRHALSASVPSEPLTVQGDRTRLVQIVANLLNNAARYTPEGGEIRVGAAADGDSVSLHVTDNGFGISPSLLPVVFELFTQGERTPDRSQGGLGIGLPLVKRLVEMHGGGCNRVKRGPRTGQHVRALAPAPPGGGRATAGDPRTPGHLATCTRPARRRQRGRGEHDGRPAPVVRPRRHRGPHGDGRTFRARPGRIRHVRARHRAARSLRLRPRHPVARGLRRRRAVHRGDRVRTSRRPCAFACGRFRPPPGETAGSRTVARTGRRGGARRADRLVRRHRASAAGRVDARGPGRDGTRPQRDACRATAENAGACDRPSPALLVFLRSHHRPSV
ncbi:hypothetical protein GCM10007067_05940 [Lysobacter bugurensis]|uniref:histidine kinase n=1 Tax=Cognatilysobacter bugurensis TaxID=543356 RepID=A0A918W4V4_9GAMM|nr:hypothetical protein GCM10007067_05940 [Lysobacter bugurensis]